MIAMAGKGQKRVPTMHYQTACGELADSLGFRPSDVWFWFCQIAWCVELECKWPREVAEWHAHRCIVAVFDKRGAQAS